MSLLVRSMIVVGMTGVGLLGGFLAKRQMLPDAVVLAGVRIDGVPAGDDPDTLAETRANALLARRVKLMVDGDMTEMSLGDLGVRVDTKSVAERARAIGKSGDFIERWDTAKKAKEGGIDVPLLPTVDHDVLVRVIAPLKELHDQQAASARLDLEHHTVMAEKYGKYLDADGAEIAVLRAARAPDATEVVVPIASYPPRINAEFVRSLDVHVVVSSFDTWFGRHGDQKRRGDNIDVAAQHLDGTVLAPGELVSFNSIVGDRSEDNGFQKSWEIYKGEMVEGVGGGTCQVASTLHAAAFFGGLDILERLPHSRPSAYIPMGLDATVVFPSVDLKMRNPYDFPVVVHAKVDGNKLTMQLLGPKKPVRVAFGREILKAKPYERKVEEDDKLHGTKVFIKQHGMRGYTIERLRTLTFDDGTQKIEKTKDTYPPTMEIYEVPVGFDQSQLPPLPEQTEDVDDEQNPPATTTTAQVTTSTDGATASTDSPYQLVDAPGAHAPTADQAHPKKTFKLTR
jgi:vancomycin resistance protein YoaR